MILDALERGESNSFSFYTFRHVRPPYPNKIKKNCDYDFRIGFDPLTHL